MKNLENYGVQEMNAVEIEIIEGGILPADAWDDNYNVLLGFVLGPIYDAGYLIGKYF